MGEALFDIVLLVGEGIFQAVPGGPAGLVWFHLRMSKGVPTFFAGAAAGDLVVDGVNVLLVGVGRFLTFGAGADVEVKLIPDKDEICRLVMVFPPVAVETSFMDELSLTLVTGIRLVVFDTPFTDAPLGKLFVTFLVGVLRLLACMAPILDIGLPLPLEDGATTFADAAKLLTFETLIPGQEGTFLTIGADVFGDVAAVWTGGGSFLAAVAILLAGSADVPAVAAKSAATADRLAFAEDLLVAFIGGVADILAGVATLLSGVGIHPSAVVILLGIEDMFGLSFPFLVTRKVKISSSYNSVIYIIII